MLTALPEIIAEMRMLTDFSIDSIAHFVNDQTQPLVRRLAAISTVAKSGLSEDEKVGRLKGCFRDEHFDIQQWVIYELSQNATLLAKVEIRKMLDHPEQEIQVEALLALARLKDDSICEVCSCWIGSDNLHRRRDGIVALGLAGTSAAEAVLKKAWHSTNLSNDDRTYVAICLAKYDNRCGESWLEKQLRQNRGVMNGQHDRALVAVLLTRMGNAWGVRELNEILNNTTMSNNHWLQHIAHEFLGIPILRDDCQRWALLAKQFIEAKGNPRE